MGFLLRSYACLFHFVLAAFLLGLGIVGLLTGNNGWNLAMMPWTGKPLTEALVAIGIMGILCVIFAAFGWIRFLLPIWALIISALMIRGFFLDGYVYSGASEFRGAAWLTFGAIGALLSSLALFQRRRTRSLN